jgi:large subunit ribosomal protein L25
MTGFEVGDSIHISHVKLPADVKSAIADRDFTIATVTAPSGLKSQDAAEDAAEAETAAAAKAAAAPAAPPKAGK